jgi:hypothetical protein
MRIHPLLASVALAAPVATTYATTYTNPATVPVQIAGMRFSATSDLVYKPLPAYFNLSDYLQEYTSPGPVLTFKVNKPASLATNIPDSYNIQLWWVDPEPEDAVENDANYESNTDDERIIFQYLDLGDYTGVTYLIANTIGTPDSTTTPPLLGAIQWSAVSTNEDTPVLYGSAQGLFTPNSDGSLAYCTAAWASSPMFNMYDYKTGRVSLYYVSSHYSLFYNLRDNNYEDDNDFFISDGTISTIGALKSDADIETVKMMAGDTSKHDAASVWAFNTTTLDHVPLWNTYTEDMFNSKTPQPRQSDYIRLVSATISDPSGTLPTHGLKFVEAPTYDVTTEDDDGEETTTTYDPNETIKKVFYVTLSTDGKLSLTPINSDNGTPNDTSDDTVFDAIDTNSYTYFFRAYVNNGTNTGANGTPYFQAQFILNMRRPFSEYMSGTAYPNSNLSTSTDFHWFYRYYSTNSITDSDDTNLEWYYVFGNYTNNYWAYSKEHGYMYMIGDHFNTNEGVYWWIENIGWVWTNYYYWTYGSNLTNYSSSDADTTIDPKYNYSYFYSYADAGWIAYIRKIEYYDSNEDGEITTDDTNRVPTLDDRLFFSFRQHKYLKGSELAKLGTGLNQ